MVPQRATVLRPTRLESTLFLKHGLFSDPVPIAGDSLRRLQVQFVKHKCGDIFDGTNL